MQKAVLLGVSAGVAIYKSCEIIRELQKRNIGVKVLMTKHATQFINPNLFRALTRQPVAVDLFEDDPQAPIHHISLAQEANLFLMAPATANVIAKLANGIADDLFSTTALATQAPILIAPAMNVGMYTNPATRGNIETLQKRGVHFIEAEEGYLTCGDYGSGRLASVSSIVEAACELLQTREDLKGKKVLITTGPTVETIDAVRYISNPSSGKTGFALAEAAYERGAQVKLVTGPVALKDPEGIDVVHVGSACEMYEAVEKSFDATDIAIFAAAVSDYRPATPVSHKLKKDKHDDKLAHIDVVENPDILASMGQRKRGDQVVVGFAAETEDLEENARKKLQSKNANFIVANLVGAKTGFQSDKNEVLFVSKSQTKKLPLLSKRQLADEILDWCLL